MGTPWIGFMRDEFGWNISKGAYSFGFLTFCLGLPCILFYQYGFFDQYDYWAGTVSLVVFALAETVLFAWIFGIDKGWTEINLGADMKIPHVFKWIIKYITPVLLLAVFLGALFAPEGDNWLAVISGFMDGQGWALDNNSLIHQITNIKLKNELLLATDPAQMIFIKKQIFYSNMARLVLVILFLFISSLVFLAYKKRKKIAL